MPQRTKTSKMEEIKINSQEFMAAAMKEITKETQKNYELNIKKDLKKKILHLKRETTFNMARNGCQLYGTWQHIWRRQP